MGRQTVYRVTGFFLSFTILVLGCASAVLLYNAGKQAIDLFYTDSYYYGKGHVQYRRMPTDTWYGEVILRAWVLGFIYMIPGATGIISSLFYHKSPMIFHLVVSILLMLVGSFIHTTGIVAMVLYRLLVLEGASRYNPLLGDCIYTGDGYGDVNLQVTDRRCQIGRQALLLAIAATVVMLIAWLFIFSDIFFRAFTFSNVKKKYKGKPQQFEPPDREYGYRYGYRTPPRRRRPPSLRKDDEPGTLGQAGETQADIVSPPPPTAQMLPSTDPPRDLVIQPPAGGDDTEKECAAATAGVTDAEKTGISIQFENPQYDNAAFEERM